MLIGFYDFMLKGESMCVSTDNVFIDGCQFGGVIDRSTRLFLSWDDLDLAFRCSGVSVSPEDIKERHDRTFNLPEPVKEQFEPASSTNNPVTTKATQRYYKLHCGNVIDIETKTILNRDTLLKILD